VSGLLARLGLHRPELRAWAMYDWANSVFMTTVLQVFPLYFIKVAAVDLPRNEASARFAWATAAAIILVGLTGPILGAMADFQGNKKTMIAFFLGIGVVATAAMGLVQRGDWVLAIVLFVIGNVGVTSTLAFYNSLLPHIARPDEVDQVSTAGFGLGYLGGGILLGLNLLVIQSPERFGLADKAAAMRLSFLSAAIWWAVFSLPLFLKVSEPARRLEAGEAGRNALLVALVRLEATISELRGHRDAVYLLVGFLIYNDAINTIIRMATTFGSEAGIPDGSLIAAILMVQFVGVPFAFAFGALAARIGAKRAIFLALAVYMVITLIAFTMRTTGQFFLLAFLVGTVMGGAQALSRSLFSTMIPRHKSAEMFGFFGVFDRFGGALGSSVFGVVLILTGSSRPAILILILFFVAGGLLLSRVDVERGQRAARESEAKVA
jgi:MFS transporter, UMF1 family